LTARYRLFEKKGHFILNLKARAILRLAKCSRLMFLLLRIFFAALDTIISAGAMIKAFYNDLYQQAAPAISFKVCSLHVCNSML